MDASEESGSLRLLKNELAISGISSLKKEEQVAGLTHSLDDNSMQSVTIKEETADDDLMEVGEHHKDSGPSNIFTGISDPLSRDAGSRESMYASHLSLSDELESPTHDHLQDLDRQTAFVVLDSPPRTPKERFEYNKRWKSVFGNTMATLQEPRSQPLSQDSTKPPRPFKTPAPDNSDTSETELDAADAEDDGPGGKFDFNDPCYKAYFKFDKLSLVDTPDKLKKILLSDKKSGKELVNLSLSFDHRPRNISVNDRLVVTRIIIDFVHTQASQGRDLQIYFSYRELRGMAKHIGAFFDDPPDEWFRLGLPGGECKKKRKTPYGCLWNRVNNIKQTWRNTHKEQYAKLRQAKIERAVFLKKQMANRPTRRAKRAKRNSSPPKEKTSAALQEELLARPLIKLLREPTTWLPANSINEDTEEALRKTAKGRHAFLCAQGTSVEKYLDLFPFFKSCNLAKAVIELDFSELNGHVPDGRLYEKLRELHGCIIQEAKRSKSIRGLENFQDTIIRAYDNTVDVTRKATAALVALPYALGTSRVRRDLAGKTVVQIAKQECAEHFILFADTEGAALECHEQRKEKNPSGEVHPYIVAIGTLGNVSHCLVRFLDQSIRTQTIIQGVDLCFKLFFVLNIQYPPLCRNVWQALETIVYEIDSDISDESDDNSQPPQYDPTAWKRHVLDILRAEAFGKRNLKCKMLLKKLKARQKKTVQARAAFFFEEPEKRLLSRAVIDFLLSKQDLTTQKPRLSYPQLKPYAAACAELMGDSLDAWFDNPLVGVGSRRPRKTPVGMLYRRYRHVRNDWAKAHPELSTELTADKKKMAAKKKALHAARERKRIPKEGKTLGRKKRAPSPEFEGNLTAEEIWGELINGVNYTVLNQWKSFGDVNEHVQRALQETAVRRHQFVKHPKGDLVKYLKTFPFMTSPECGQKLVEQDFLMKYPDNSDTGFFSSLIVANNALVDILEALPPCKKPKFLTALKETDDISLKITLLLLALPYATQALGFERKKGQKKATPISVELVIARWATVVENESAVETHHEQLKESSGMVLPYIIAVGPDLLNATRAQVRFLDYAYSCDTLLSAFVLCFKIFHVFGLSYPPETLHLWEIVQHFFSIPFPAHYQKRVAASALIDKIQNYIAANNFPEFTFEEAAESKPGSSSTFIKIQIL